MATNSTNNETAIELSAMDIVMSGFSDLNTDVTDTEARLGNMERVKVLKAKASAMSFFMKWGRYGLVGRMYLEDGTEIFNVRVATFEQNMIHQSDLGYFRLDDDKLFVCTAQGIAINGAMTPKESQGAEILQRVLKNLVDASDVVKNPLLVSKFWFGDTETLTSVGRDDLSLQKRLARKYLGGVELSAQRKAFLDQRVISYFRWNASRRDFAKAIDAARFND